MEALEFVRPPDHDVLGINFADFGTLSRLSVGVGHEEFRTLHPVFAERFDFSDPSVDDEPVDFATSAQLEIWMRFWASAWIAGLPFRKGPPDRCFSAVLSVTHTLGKSNL